MKTVLLIILFFFILNHSFSQKTSLLIRTNGDSIICKIDSITDTEVYIKLRTVEYTWAKSSISISEVASIKYNVSSNDIRYSKSDSISIKRSIRYFNKNNINVSTDLILYGYWTILFVVNYERLFTISDHFAISGKIGLAPFIFYKIPPLIFEVNLLAGKSLAIFESAIGIINILQKGYGYDNNIIPYLRFNYRLQNTNWFLFKIGPTIYFDDLVFFGVGISLGVTF